MLSIQKRYPCPFTTAIYNIPSILSCSQIISAGSTQTHTHENVLRNARPFRNITSFFTTTTPFSSHVLKSLLNPLGNSQTHTHENFIILTYTPKKVVLSTPFTTTIDNNPPIMIYSEIISEFKSTPTKLFLYIM